MAIPFLKLQSTLTSESMEIQWERTHWSGPTGAEPRRKVSIFDKIQLSRHKNLSFWDFFRAHEGQDSESCFCVFLPNFACAYLKLDFLAKFTILIMSHSVTSGKLIGLCAEALLMWDTADTSLYTIKQKDWAEGRTYTASTRAGMDWWDKFCFAGSFSLHTVCFSHNRTAYKDIFLINLSAWLILLVRVMAKSNNNPQTISQYTPEGLQLCPLQLLVKNLEFNLSKRTW